MPTIPKYDTQIQPITPTVQKVQQPNAPQDAFGANVARANQSIAQGVGDIGQVLAKHVENQRRLQNEAFVADQDVKYTLDLQNRLNSNELEKADVNGQKIERPKGILARKGLNTQGSTFEMDEWQRKTASKYLDGIKDPELKARVAKNITSSYVSARNSVISHEAKQVREGYVKHLESSRDLKIGDVSNITDKAGLDESINKIAVLQDQINKAEGYDNATAQVEFKKSIGKFVENAINSGLKVDPSGKAARQMLQDLSDKLSPEDSMKMSDYIDKEVKANASILMDDLNSKFIDGTITLEDIQSANIPKEEGGIGSSAAKKMLKDLGREQADKLETFRSDSKLADNYIQSVEGVLFGQDAFKAKQILVDAYADGTMDRSEAQKINRIKGILDRQKFTRDGDLRTNIPVIKNWFAANESDNKELAKTLSNYLTALDEGVKPDEAREAVLKDQYNRTYPQAPLGPEDKVNDPTREKQLVTMSIPERFGRGFSQGVAGTVQGFGGALRWLKQEELGKAVSDYGKQMKQFYAIPDPKFIDQVSAGFGSMATFFIPGMGITKGVQAASFFPRLATWLGVGASTALEATVEAGSVYEQGLQKGMPPKDAENAASKTFWVNIPTLAITNKLGIFGENGNAIARSIKASGFEGFQEFSQSIISNISLHDPAFEGAFESAVVGAIVGGGTKLSVEAGASLKEMAKAKEELGKFEEKQQETSSRTSLNNEKGSVRISGQEDSKNSGDKQIATMNGKDVPVINKAVNATTEDLVLNPEKVKGIIGPAFIQDGKVYGGKFDLNNNANHSDVFIANNLNQDTAKPGFLTDKGEFVYQYSEDLPKQLNQSNLNTDNPLNYKTAEEYVASKRKPYYHGTNKNFDNFKLTEGNRSTIFGGDKKVENQAIFLSPDKNTASFFGQNRTKNLGGDFKLIEAYPEVKKTLDLNSIKDKEIKTKALDILEKWEGKKQKTIKKINHQVLLDNKEFVQLLKSKGFDSVVMNESNLLKEGSLSSIGENLTLAILEPDIIKTKSQLIAEWEAAQKNKPQDRTSLNNERGSVTIPDITVPKSVTKAGKDLSQFADAALTPLSTRLGRINEGLRDSLRRFEFNNGLSMKQDLDKAMPFLEHMADMPEAESSALDLALKNADRQTINEIVDRNGIRGEYENVREVLDDLYNRAREVGLDVRYLDDYFPRRVENPEEFMNYLRNSENWSAIDKAIKQEEAKIGSRLNNEERAEFINKMLRGYGDSQIRISKPSNIKSRKIQIIDEQMNAFYKNSTTTLQEYIVAMNKAIEAKKFFGVNNKDVEDSIGAYVSDLVDSGLINHAQEKEVANILKARFSERGTHGIWSFYKNLGYLYTMSSPISAITQIGDLAFGLYENGFYSTAKGLGKAFSKNKITKQDLGIDVISDEFSDRSKSGEAVTKVFKLIGLEGMDNIGKETLINGAMDKLSREANEGNPELMSELERVFGEEAPQTLEDLKNNEPSVNVKYLLFSRLAKYQPISLSEMPEYYANGGNLRIFYMLKSYTIKQLDVFQNEVFSQMQTNPKKAIGNLVKLSLALASLNAGADVIKDVLLGRPIRLSDLAVDNILKLFGFSKYTIYKAKREGLGEAVMKTILPPIPFVDDLYRDIAKGGDLTDYKLWNSIPFVGKFYYWWFGGGREYLDKNNRKKKRTKSAF